MFFNNNISKQITLVLLKVLITFIYSILKKLIGKICYNCLS